MKPQLNPPQPGSPIGGERNRRMGIREVDGLYNVNGPFTKRPLQTMAVYWEPKIKTYGFQVGTDLSLIEFTFPAHQLSSCGLMIYELGQLPTGFHLVASHTSADGTCRIFLLIQRHSEGRVLDYMGRIGGSELKEAILVTSPVDLIHFQGPHYGDRYGIATAVFEALASVSVPVLLAACSQSCVYLVLPEAKAREAEVRLREVFEVPAKKAASSGGAPQSVERAG